MKKIINDPSNVVSEMVDGLVRAYPQYLTQIDGTEAVVRTNKDSMKGKVGLVSGGGSGHEPAHAGYVGQGMLSAAVCGQVFTSPTPDQIYEAIKAVDQGQGVFCIVKNYSGDVMNFDMAKDLAEADGIDVKSVVVDDDIAVKDSLYTQGRRGVAGTVFVHKILGAAADQGATLDEIEYGVGIHSEPGYRREKIKPSKELVDELVGKLNDEMHLDKNKKYAVLVNGMGATPLMEQYVFSHDLLNKLDEFGIKPDFMRVGNYLTSIDMAGLSLTIFEIKDDKWLNYLNYPVKTIAWN